jgi:hypothetical protein
MPTSANARVRNSRTEKCPCPRLIGQIKLVDGAEHQILAAAVPERPQEVSIHPAGVQIMGFPG